MCCSYFYHLEFWVYFSCHEARLRGHILVNQVARPCYFDIDVIPLGSGDSCQFSQLNAYRKFAQPDILENYLFLFMASEMLFLKMSLCAVEYTLEF